MTPTLSGVPYFFVRAHPPATSGIFSTYSTYPVECRAWFEADPRQPEDVPCYYEALDVLACGK